MRLRPQSEVDALLRTHVETNAYVKEDGTLYEPTELPEPDDPFADEDGDVGADDEARASNGSEAGRDL
jgi:hypothetical protein